MDRQEASQARFDAGRRLGLLELRAEQNPSPEAEEAVRVAKVEFEAAKVQEAEAERQHDLMWQEEAQRLSSQNIDQ